MDTPFVDNPAVARQTNISPALLQEIAESPGLVPVIAKKMTMVQLDVLHRILKNPDATVSIGQRIAGLELTAKVAQLLGQASIMGQGSGPQAPPFSVNIIMPPPAAPAAPAAPARVTIEATDVQAKVAA